MTRLFGRSRPIACCGLAAILLTTAAHAQVVHQAATQAMQPAAALQDARPLERTLPALPKEAFQLMRPFTGASAMPAGVAGRPGESAPALPPLGRTGPARGAAPRIAPENFGAGNLNTVYHFSDRLVDAELDNDMPWRWAGRLTLTTAANENVYCSAALISRSILLTAGHCVHQGGNLPGRAKAKGWTKSAVYTPAYRRGAAPYGSAIASSFLTTTGWYDQGELDQGYDVGLVVLNKRTGTRREIGADTGHFGFCHTDCLQPYWALTQLGFPHNYYLGAQMTQGEHLERSNGRDFLHGSGMRGGSSGGPHIVNFGEISDSATSRGLFTARNWIFAVTSWGYVGESFKVQGASSLSGPRNANNFKKLFNLACTRARALHGASSCSLL
jgi:V8-like Glu-specific endopeptidase